MPDKEDDTEEEVQPRKKGRNKVENNITQPSTQPSALPLVQLQESQPAFNDSISTEEVHEEQGNGIEVEVGVIDEKKRLSKEAKARSRAIRDKEGRALKIFKETIVIRNKRAQCKAGKRGRNYKVPGSSSSSPPSPPPPTTIHEPIRPTLRGEIMSSLAPLKRLIAEIPNPQQNSSSFVTMVSEPGIQSVQHHGNCTDILALVLHTIFEAGTGNASTLIPENTRHSDIL